MAVNVNSFETSEVITDNRESPLLFRGFEHPVIRQSGRNLRNRNVRKKHFCLLKWVNLSISATFVVNIIVGRKVARSFYNPWYIIFFY